ncbi:MAG TPA: hypothetical protein VG733_02940 [Chthoniobacteraceae bacterium]|nr:hypothetical protein [Chthoniobacteraceae bacterium]
MELERRAQRVADRAHLWQEQRKLASAEIRLGELGWQQADFPPEVDVQVQAIMHVERQQTEYSNKGAEIQSSIEEVRYKRESKREAHLRQIAAIETELKPLYEAREVAREPLAGLQEGVARFDQAVAGLRETDNELASQLAELQAIVPANMEIQQRMMRVKDQRIQCDFQIEDMLRARLKLENQIKRQTQEVASVDLKIQDVNIKINDLREAFEAADKELQAEINALALGHKETGKMMNRLDRQKSAAFLAVGRCLADYHIAPMNQPAALELVYSQRNVVRTYKDRIAESMAASAQTGNAPLIALGVATALFVAIVVIAASFLLARLHSRASTRDTHSSMIAMCAATRWSSANSEGVSTVNVRIE